MPRIAELQKSDLPDNLHGLWDKFSGGYGDFTNQARVLAHSPDAFFHLYGLIDAWRQAGTLPQRLIEIAVVTVSTVNQCPYCVGHHGVALLKHGLSAETVAAILDPEVPGLDAREHLVRDYARLVTERAWGIRDTVFEQLAGHFTQREIVELTVRIGICGLFNKFNQALQIEIEDNVNTEMTAQHIHTAPGAV